MVDQCIAPDQIDAGDLLAYIDGVATPAVAAHIERCPGCATEIAALRSTDALLHDALYRAGCPQPDELLQYQAGLLPEREGQISRHVATCRLCQSDLAELAGPEPGLIERLRQTGLRILTAVRSTLSPQAALALRGAEGFREVYRAGAYQIVVALIPPVATEPIWQIEGQLTAQDGSELADTGTVWLLRAGEVVAHDPIDELHFFTFDQVAPGAYALTIELGGTRLVIENLHIP